jgi:hypothetical protein
MSKDNKSFEVLASTHFSLFSRVLAAAAAGKERLQQQQEGSSTARNKLGKITSHQVKALERERD